MFLGDLSDSSYVRIIQMNSRIFQSGCSVLLSKMFRSLEVHFWINE